MKRAWSCLGVHVILAALVSACGGAAEPTPTSRPSILPSTPAATALVTPTPAASETGIAFPDPDLEVVIRGVLDRSEGAITAEDLAGLTELDATSNGVVAAHNSLSKYRGQSTFDDLYVTDLSGLEHLTNLTSLSFDYGRVSDFSPLGSLTKLTRLRLTANVISDLSPIAKFPNLTELSIQANQINDASSLADLTGLIRLDLSRTGISDLSPLASLTDLTELRLTGASIDDLSPLASLTNLTELHLDESELVDISPLAGLTSLTILRLGFNQVSDLSPLVENVGLGEGDRVDLIYNDLDLREGSEDVENIRVLQSRGVIVEHNPIDSGP